jgi:DNA polymerase III sliding clamp (beta) subunit (PCNA family)
MKISRAELSGAVGAVRPAVATRDLIPELTNVWFEKTKVWAYNDVIAIEVPLKTDLEGGVSAKVMCGCLDSSSAADVTITLDKNSLKLKCGAADIKLPMVSMVKALWAWPKEKATWTIPGEPIAEAFKYALVSATDDYGVLFKQGPKETFLYGTDGKTLTRYGMKVEAAKAEQVMLPRAFCEQWLALSGEKAGTIGVRSNCVTSELEHGRLFGRILDRETKDFDGVIAKFVAASKGNNFPIPEDIASALARATILLEASGGAYVTATVANGQLTISLHDSRDHSLLETFPMKGHPDIEVSFNPKHLERGLELYNRITFLSEGLFLQHDKIDALYLISAHR